MLSGYNDEMLISSGVREEVVPFYQRWQELMNKKTLDIYQYKIMTSLTAMQEMVEVIKKTQAGLFTTDANIKACREELLFILNHDKVLMKYNRAILNRLEYTLRGESEKDAVHYRNRILHRLNYVINQIDADYLRHALNELRQTIIDRNMEDMELYINIVASQSIYNGWSAQALNELLRYFTMEEMKAKEFDEQWDIFSRQLLNNRKSVFDVLIYVPFKPQQRETQTKLPEILQRSGLDIKSYDELCQIHDDLRDIRSLLNADKRYFYVQEEAYDIYTAAHLAVVDVSEQLNMASFYNLLSAWDLSSVVIIPINKSTRHHKSFTAVQIYQTYDYIDISGTIFEHTQRIFRDENRKTVREKLKGSFSYTNISRASLFQEEKYMNLWVALESLARTEMYKDIISNVKNTVPAAVCLRYVYRIVRNYVEDCSRCGVSFEFTGRNVDMHQESKQIMVRETIKIFKNPVLYTELLEKSNVNMLLRYRTESIHKLLTDSRCAVEKIKKHYDRISWQIQRLYRIRNEIAHAALREQNLLITYVEHLYDYLSTYISEIITCMIDNDLNSIEEVLSLIKDNYDVFVAYANNKENDILQDTILRTGIINLICS